MLPILAGEASEAGTAVTTMLTALKAALADFSVENLSAIIVAGLAIAVPLIIGWFAFRFVFRKAKGALKKGS